MLREMNEFDEKDLALRRRLDAVSCVLIDLAKYVRRAPEYYCRKDIQHFYPIDELKNILDEIDAEVIAPIKDKFSRLYGTTPEEFDNVWRSGLDSMFVSSFCHRCAQNPSIPPQIPLVETDESDFHDEGCKGR